MVCFQDLAQCVNEVKRDNEIIRQITTFQLSIENMVRVSCFCIFFFSFLHCSSSLLRALDPFSRSLRAAKD